MGSFIELAAADGHRFAAWQAAPQGKARGAVVIAPEIFGVNSHIRAVTDGYAADGYLAIAPALFDRVQRNYETGYAPDEIQAGVAIMQRIDFDDALKDVAAAIAHAASAGRVAVIGYCWGGTVAWLAACELPVAAAASYYGGGIVKLLAQTPKCPVIYHYGEKDSHIPLADVEKIRAAHPAGVFHIYPADHGFNCTERAAYDAPSAALAFERTLAFFAGHVG